ncbi:recombinase family protein [Sinorhizobium fredii]|uniref:recombinase family protein n=1 Tax=Rhizobium fredii TaxID=380 RepID=UPI0029587E15|nr:recombinase family protein [Sinorhizobium fredii]WOS64637.1 recombinase family protein [Sinorhizobium fredii GR64]
MTKVAIYARYSSDKQREASIEDQIRLCEERAAREGWTVTRRYKDQAISGASLMRAGIQALMQDAQDRKFDLVLTESLDRISRDQEDIAGVYKRLRFAGVSMLTLSEGPISELHIGFKGTMGALYLKDLADKTRRGQRGRIEAGKSGGGNSYGYDVVVQFTDAGEPIRGDRRVNESEAATVRQIFNDYATGKSPKAIAHALNRRGVPGPSGKGWGPSTINGNWRRGTGILNNEMYVGKLVWNRLAYIKNPDTGNRVSRLNDQSAWVVKDVPELRIVDQELWERVKARQEALRHQPSFHERQRPRMLLSYLLKCGCCGGGMSKVSQNHYGCSTARDKGTCENRVTIRQDELEGMVIAALQSRLMEPALLEEFCAEYTRHMNKLRNEKNASLGTAKSELAKLAKARDNIIQAIKDGVPATEVKDDLARITARREELESLLAGTKEEPVLLHPGMAAHYRDQVANLAQALNREENRAEAADLLRSLVDRITLTPNDQGKLEVDLYGDLAGILTLAANAKGPLDESGPLQDKLVAGMRNHLALAGKEKGRPDARTADLFEQVKVVAGAGFEPAAFRL